VSLADLKAFLRVTHDDDDTLLAALLASAEDEMERYLEASELPAAPSVQLGVWMLVRSAYDTETPDDALRWRQAAHSTAHSYRTGLGV
jgi:hypothetical protein